MFLITSAQNTKLLLLRYLIQTTATTGDEGVDLILHKDTRLAVVQCKRYEGSVGQPVVRDLYGAMLHNRADEAYLVTTGTITLPAQRWATGKPIHLVDGNTLIDWIASFKEIEEPSPSTIKKNTSGSRLTFAKFTEYWRRNTISAGAILISVLLPVFICSSGLVISSATSTLVAPVPANTPTAIPILTPTATSTELPSSNTPIATKSIAIGTPIPTVAKFPQKPSNN